MLMRVVSLLVVCLGHVVLLVREDTTMFSAEEDTDMFSAEVDTDIFSAAEDRDIISADSVI